MRLKTLRKVQPAFESEGALIRGNRIALSNSETRSPRHQIHLDLDDQVGPPPTELASLPSEPTNENCSHDQRDSLTIQDGSSQVTEMKSYKAIEAAYLEHGIRIRLTPTKSNPNTAARRSSGSQRHTSFSNRNPSRTSSVLQYAPARPELDQETRSFSVLQQTSSNTFDGNQKLTTSFAQSSTQCLNETNQQEYFSPSIVATEYSNPIVPSEKPSIMTPRQEACNSVSNDPDLAYMCSLLTTSIGQSYRETIRRRAGLRDTFAVHRHPVYGPTSPSVSREKSPSMLKTSALRSATMSVTPSSPSPEKIDKDIIKHASRLRLSHLKDFSRRSPAVETTPRVTSSKSHLIHRPTQTTFKSISLEPLELLLSQRFPRSSSLSLRTASSAKFRLPEATIHRNKSAKLVPIDSSKSAQNSLLEQSFHGASSSMHQDSFTSMKPFQSNGVRQSGSFDSGYYDQSSSGGDFQSLTSSSVMQGATSVPSARLNSSTTRRSNATKKVSFYEEPTATILRTATYV